MYYEYSCSIVGSTCTAVARSIHSSNRSIRTYILTVLQSGANWVIQLYALATVYYTSTGSRVPTTVDCTAVNTAVEIYE